jgi:hypothetical protein
MHSRRAGGVVRRLLEKREGLIRVARTMAPHVMRLDDLPMPVPQSGEALVWITAVGYWGSDLQYDTQGRIGELAFGAGHALRRNRRPRPRCLRFGGRGDTTD